jgi:hypothetical protein
VAVATAIALVVLEVVVLLSLDTLIQKQLHLALV